MDLSIIIVNWNTRDLLRDALASLPAACSGLAYEVLVVDNASADDSVGMVATEFPQTTIIAAPGNVGFSRGNNLAFDQTTGEHVLLLNPDTVCKANALSSLVAFARTKANLGVVGPCLLAGDDSPTISYGLFPSPRFHWLGFLDPWRLLPGRYFQDRIVVIPNSQTPSQEVDYIAGACFLMPRAALDLVGPLDERFFMYFEETDWCWRARKAGLQNWYYSDSSVIHLEGQAAEQASQFSILQFQKSYRLYVEKNMGSAHLFNFRLGQFFEYGMKALLRRIAPGNRQKNRLRAATFWMRAKLQWQDKIEVEIPRAEKK
jgi:N-acetylglucosaminyl-diphospho-decaprenol L-rhamnosyltransferase